MFGKPCGLSDKDYGVKKVSVGLNVVVIADTHAKLDWPFD